MPDFDFKEKFPISQYIQGVIEKKKMEEASKQYGTQQLLQGIRDIGGVAQDVVDQRNETARALAQASILKSTNPNLESQDVTPLSEAIKGISGSQFLDNAKSTNPLDDLLKTAKIDALKEGGGTASGGKPQLRQNAFNGQWEWYFPPNQSAPGEGTSNRKSRQNSSGTGGASEGIPRGTFRDVSKAIAEASDAQSTADSVVSELERISPLNKNSRGGFIGGLIQKGQSASNLGTNSAEFKNTADVINTLKNQVATVLKSTFGGQLSDGERAYLNEVYGAVEGMTPAERSIAIQNVMTKIRAAQSRAANKVSALRGQKSSSPIQGGKPLSRLEELRQKRDAGTLQR